MRILVRVDFGERDWLDDLVTTTQNNRAEAFRRWSTVDGSQIEDLYDAIRRMTCAIEPELVEHRHVRVHNKGNDGYKKSFCDELKDVSDLFD